MMLGAKRIASNEAEVRMWALMRCYFTQGGGRRLSGKLASE